VLDQLRLCIFAIGRLGTYLSVKFGESVVKLKVADKLQAWKLVVIVLLSRLQLLFEHFHDLHTFYYSQVFYFLHADPVSKLFHKGLCVELLLAKMVD